MQYLKKYKSMPEPARASLWYTVCNLLQKGISFIIVPIYTRILTQAEYGRYSVFQSWRDILIIFATLNLYAGVFTKAMVDYVDDRDRYTSCMQGLSTILTAVLLAIYFCASGMWNRLLKMDMITVLLMFGYFITHPAFTFWSVRQRVTYHYRRMVIVTLLVSVLTPAVSIYLLYHTNLRENAVIWGFLFVQSAVGLYFYIAQFIQGKCFYHREYWLHALRFNIPLVPHYLSLIVLGQADRIMIEHYVGADKSGIYNLAYQVSMIMNIFIAAVNGSLVPWSYEMLKQRAYPVLRRMITQLCVVMGVITMGVMLIAPEVVLILGDRAYMEAQWIIPSVALSVYFIFCYNQFSTVEFYYSETKFVMVASVTGAVLNLILNAIFIPIFGYIAAGYTTMVCYFVFMIMHYFFMVKVCRENTGGDLVYDIRFMFGSSVALFLFSLVCMVLYRGWIARYVLIAIALAAAFLNRKRLIGIIKSMK